MELADEQNRRRRREESSNNKNQQHFNYRTIIANVQPVPIVPKRQQIIDAYNVRVIEHKSPFLDQIQPIKSMSDLSSSIVRLEQLSLDLSTLSTANQQQSGSQNTNTSQLEQPSDNNNEANFNLNQFMKQKPAPFEVYSNQNRNENEERNDDNDDGVSLVSSCSLRSSRTYHIRCQDNNNTLRSEQRLNLDDDLNDASDFPVESIEYVGRDTEAKEEEEEQQQLDDQSDEKKPRAWVFDLRNNSATAIVAPPKPTEPEAAKVETEELARSRGGRSYYLELVEDKSPRRSLNENLYTRWSSHNALNSARKVGSDSASTGQESAVNLRKSRQSDRPSGGNKQQQQQPQKQQQQPRRASSVTPANQAEDANKSPTTATLTAQRQLPPRLANRSKSVSCLASSTRPSKYSIYGGFKKPDADKKPVPRLSYSRAIGPKSKRQIDNQPKTPSRYLKMK